MYAQPIRSSDNPRYKAARRLLSSRGRRQQERIAIFGVREVMRALRADVAIDEVFFCRELLNREQLIEVEQQLSSSAAPVWEIPKQLIEALEYGERREGLFVVAKRPSTELAGLQLPQRCLVVVLESAEKPGNVGAVARTAVAAGADALILAEPISDLYHPNCIRASLGCIFAIRAATGSSAEVRDWLVAQGISIAAARTDAATIYTAVDFRSSTAIVLGSESSGLSDAWDGPGIVASQLPMSESADSLNVSVTAAVLLYEAVRQRSVQSG
jgi:TrmH family RNA methyltransferase